MFPCSLEKIGVSPLFSKNKLRCSVKFTLVKFPCSQKSHGNFRACADNFLPCSVSNFALSEKRKYEKYPLFLTFNKSAFSNFALCIPLYYIVIGFVDEEFAACALKIYITAEWVRNFCKVITFIQ